MYFFFLGEWSTAALEPLLVKMTEDKGIKLGQLAQPMRSALTGARVTD